MKKQRKIRSQNRKHTQSVDGNGFRSDSTRGETRETSANALNSGVELTSAAAMHPRIYVSSGLRRLHLPSPAAAAAVVVAVHPVHVKSANFGQWDGFTSWLKPFWVYGTYTHVDPGVRLLRARTRCTIGVSRVRVGTIGVWVTVEQRRERGRWREG